MTDAIVSGLLLGFALVFSVGPVVFTIIKLRINYGIVSAFYFVSGVWLSDILLVFIANFFGQFLSNLIAYKKTIGICGGLFLVGLGLFYLLKKKYKKDEQLESGIKISGTTHARLFATGFIINTLNPSVIALWIATSTNAVTSTFNQKLVIFGLCLFINICADVAKIYLAGKLKNNLTERNINIINIISGLLFIAFGVALIVSVL
jgi:threonine/homoserine/homoserine lactone efflux protein